MYHKFYNTKEPGEARDGVALRRLFLLLVFFTIGFTVGGLFVFRHRIQPEQLMTGRWYGQYSDSEISLRWVKIRTGDGSLVWHRFFESQAAPPRYRRDVGYWELTRISEENTDSHNPKRAPKRIPFGTYRIWRELPFEIIADYEILSIESKRTILRDPSDGRILTEFRIGSISFMGELLDGFRYPKSDKSLFEGQIQANLETIVEAAREVVIETGVSEVTFETLSATAPRIRKIEPVAGETYEHIVYPNQWSRFVVLTSAGDLIELTY